MKTLSQKFIFQVIILVFIFSKNYLSAQTIPIGTPVLDDYLRRAQLLGKIDSASSFMIRPLHPVSALGVNYGFDLDGSIVDLDKSTFHKRFGKDSSGVFLILPFSIKSQYNSSYAFGANDGAFIPNRGLQTLLSGGFFAKKGKFSLQLQPEILQAQNKDYQGFPIGHQSTVLYYYEYLNRIDSPERFGNKNFNRAYLGQSSLRFNHNQFSIGISTENLWWGPGLKNSLLLGNNAPGFLHFTINTIEPVQTKIGSFEGQIIAGFLKSSGFNPPLSDYIFQETPAFMPKRPNGNRYLSGLVLTYQPKWVKGLFLGYGSVNNMYRDDMTYFSDFLPVFNGRKKFEVVFDPITNKRQQLSSGYFRWLSTTGKFEFYGEYGTNGNNRSLEKFLVTPESGRGYTFGFSYLMDLKKQGHYLQVSSEMTHIGQTIREDIQNLESWYIHEHVRHGYTHQGQVLGVGHGPGSILFFLEFAWVHKMNKLGLQIERIAYNNDFYNFRFETSKDLRNKYIDLVPSLIGDWKFGNLLVSAKFQYVDTFNYKWYLENDPVLYWVPGYDRTNFVGQVGLTYLLR
jgi:hypothetical protein